MGNIGINNQYTPVAKPSIVRLKMNNGVDNGAGIPPSVQFGKAEGGRSPVLKAFTTYNLPKPGEVRGTSPDLSGSRLGSIGGLNAANGGQLGNKAVFNLYEMVSLMITLGNSLTKTFREQMAARVVGEISKLHDEARTLTNAAYTARTMGIVSAAAGGTLGTLSLGGTLATGVAAKSASAASGLDSASKALDKANLEMKPLQDFSKAQECLNDRGADVLNRALEKTFTGQEGELPKADIATELEQKTKGILAFEDNEKTIGELKSKLEAGAELKQNAPNNNENNINNVNNESVEIKNEELPGLTPEERAKIEKDIKSLKQKNAELDNNYDISKKYCKKVGEGGKELRPSEVYRQELHDRFEGKYRENADLDGDEVVPNGDFDIKPDGFDSKVDGEASLKGHPFDRKAVKEAGAKWLERQDAILDGSSEQTARDYSNAKMAFGRAQDIYKFKMENSRAFSFTQAVSGMGQGLIPVLQLLTGGAGVNELANARTKDLQAGERADSYNAGEMQAMKDGLKGIVDGALQVMSTAVSSYAQFQNTVNSNFRA